MLGRSTPESWTALDPVSALLIDLRLSGTFFCNSDLGAPWLMAVPERDFASFHFVADGECWLRLPGERARSIAPGELVLLPQSPAHQLASSSSMRGRLVNFDLEQRFGESSSVFRQGDKDPRSRLVCGGVRFEGFVSSAIASMLPSVVVTTPTAQHDTVSMALDAMSREVRAARAGGATILSRLLDLVVLHALRSWIESASDHDSGWLRALRDHQVGRALVAVHTRPEAAWSLDSMATAANLSRSAFARRFVDLLGVPPKQYLTRVRMHRALELLRSERASVAEVAERLGYDSEAAFARAFKRHIGFPPGAARRLPNQRRRG